MKEFGRLLCLAVGLVFGALLAGLFVGNQKPALAANDHSEDYIMCTGAVSADFKLVQQRYHPAIKTIQGQKEAIPIEGVWLLDYRSGKLLGTVIDRSAGKIVGWADVDLVAEFGIAP